jgi:tRNA-dihydrouridine synthase
MRAKQAARAATLANRHAPPLRLSVVRELALAFPQMEVLANGGVQSLDGVREQMSAGCAGAMVGRAVINHPCAFARADALWAEGGRHAGKDATGRGVAGRDWSSGGEVGRQLSVPTEDGKGGEATGGGEAGPCSGADVSRRGLSRGEVLERFAAYCDAEEASAAALRSSLHGSAPSWLLPSQETLRRRIVACPYNLFAGVAGGERFQRRLRKLAGKRLGTERASLVLRAAAAELPEEALALSVDEAIPVTDLVLFEKASKRAGPMQRFIH